jgi:hypothetical protein
VNSPNCFPSEKKLSPSASLFHSFFSIRGQKYLNEAVQLVLVDVELFHQLEKFRVIGMEPLMEGGIGGGDHERQNQQNGEHFLVRERGNGVAIREGLQQVIQFSLQKRHTH